MEIIASKIALTLTSSNWKWLHEEAWTDKHRIFASNCRNFTNTGIHKVTWLSLGKKGQPPQGYGGQSKVGKWLLIDSQSEQVWSSAEFFWEDGNFEQGWLRFKDEKSAPEFSLDLNPINWLIETIISRLRPDMLTITGDVPVEFGTFFDVVKFISPTQRYDSLENGILYRLDSRLWENYQGSKGPKEELGWIRKRVDRETKEFQKLSQPRKQPFLLRILLAMSPFRKMRRDKMIHPLTKYRAKL